jgi:hypothetical protein
MKTLKLIVLIIMILGFNSKIANSQPKNREYYTYENWSYYSQCAGEELKGTLYQEIKVGQHYLEKTTGTLIGQTTGDKYFFDNIWQGHWYEFENDVINYTVEFKVLLTKDGKLVSIWHMKSTFKVTPSGQESNTYCEFEDCK